jgi:hypothetical protein
MPALVVLSGIVAAVALSGAAVDPARHALPSPSRTGPVPPAALFSDAFADRSLGAWQPDRAGVWSVRQGMLRADLPDEKQQRSFLATGDSTWTDYALEFDVCMMRGVDKGAAVRVEGDEGIGFDLRGPGYNDAVLHRGWMALGKARVVNGNGVWHHVRIEARGPRYRVLVNDVLIIDRVDRSNSRQRGGIALAAYTGGVGQCTVYYDNVVVVPVAGNPAAAR